LTVKGQILRSASIVAFVTAISRICGYLRDQRVTLLLGTSPAADAFILVFRIPNMIRRMTGGGALSASFIPLFTFNLRERSKDSALRFAQFMMWDIALVMAVVAILGSVFSRQVVGLFTFFGNTHLSVNLAVYLNRIVFPCVFFIALAALASAVLNSFQIFGLPASTGVFFNLTVILFSFGVFYRPLLASVPLAFRTPAIALAAGVLLGTMLQFIIQVPSLVEKGMCFAPRLSLSDPSIRRVGRLMAPAFFGVGVYQINFFVDTIFATASRMPAGSVTSLYIADRIMELVLGGYAIAMATALLPTMSQQAAAGRFSEMKETFGFSLRVVSFITIPASVGLVLLRHPIVQVLFQHGRFVAESTALTAHALIFYSMGLPAYAAIKLITPMYYSTQDALTPARVGLCALGLNITLNLLFLIFLFRYLSNGTPALASSLTAYFNFALLFTSFRKRYGSLGAKGIIASLAKMSWCALAMAGVCLTGLRYSNFDLPRSFITRAGLLGGLIFLAVGAYFIVAWFLRCEELPEFLLLLRRGGRAAVPAAALEP
jgi:putative peptidoglycan lipid II flippase